jgi:bifunctional non-homologous end joining protein LigD
MLSPMRLLRIPEPFDHADWIFEPKLDGFRALAHIEGHRCTLISRNGHIFKSWPQLAEEIAHSIRTSNAVIDGEIACLEADGRSNFRNLLFRREWPHFVAFDLLAVGGEDLRPFPLIERKRCLASIMPKIETRVMLMEHIEERGADLFRAVCDHDLEGVVGKWKDGSYSTDPRATSWVKIKNTAYSQMEGRAELFQGSRALEPQRPKASRLTLQLA